jgi:hypothetical protein
MRFAPNELTVDDIYEGNRDIKDVLSQPRKAIKTFLRRKSRRLRDRTAA